MNLIVDIGNTQTKVATFEEGEITWQKTYSSLTQFKNDVGQLKIENSIVSSVSNMDLTNFVTDVLGKPLVLNSSTKLPIKNLYKTPSTLGNDRVANAVAASRLFVKSNTLIVDTGTCLKFDFINNKNEYLGGAIAPGLRMRFQALNTFTANLPFIEDFEKSELIGNSTETSIVSGCLNGFLNEIEGTIRSYKHKLGNIKVVLTGGDSTMIEKMDFSQKNSIFADRWLTLKGLNEILKYNVEK